MILGVIPARYGSTRFPGKALARIGGKPLVQRVWEQARKAKRLDRLVVATDDPRILEAVKQMGGEGIMTSSDLPSGTDRVWAAARTTAAEVILNLQGDEPLLQPEMVDRLAEVLARDPGVAMATLRFPTADPQGYADPNVVKVVADSEGWALYFSRSPIPFNRAGGAVPSPWYKHLGMYGYRRELLEQFVRWPVSALEKTEGLEQLRALEHGVRIKVVDSPWDTIGVDTPEDLKRVEAILKSHA